MTHGRMRKVALTLFGLFIVSQSPLVSAAEPQTQLRAVPGEYVVKLKSRVDTSANVGILKLRHALGGVIQQTISSDLSLVLLKKSIVETSESVLATLNQNELVEYAEPNFIYRVVGGVSGLPTDPEFGKLWGLVNTGQAVSGDAGDFTAKAGVDIDVARAWPLETGSKQVIVAVIDTGVNYNDPDLADNIYNNMAEINGQPLVDDDKNGYVDDFHGANIVGKNGDPMDVFGHGTHVSGTIGARANDGIGIVGVAWNVTILPRALPWR